MRPVAASSRRRTGRARLRAGVGSIALVWATGCSDSIAAQVAPTVTTVAPSTTATTELPTTVATTAVTDGTAAQQTTTTVAPPPLWPLTGVPVAFAVVPDRPAMVVKLDNHPAARPQTGLNEADIVFEENVEQLTRFAAVFQSNGTDPVGPIRSGRTQDVDLLGSFSRPLFVWSGGNRRVTDAIVASDLREISPRTDGPFFRTDRPGPHDLYSNMSALYALAPADAGPPPAQFRYRDAGEQAAGLDIAGMKVSMDGVRVWWQWDAATTRFLRFTDDAPHRDTVDDAQVSTDNVVVLSVDYVPSPADGRSPEAQTLGEGNALVASGGRLVEGTWSRPDRLSPFVLADAAGTMILLAPGRTFIELARAGKAVSVPAGADAAAVAYP